MTTIVKRGTTRKQLASLLKSGRKRRVKRKGVEVRSFAGKLTLKEDPLALQKKMRNGWTW